jgi:exopolysaccharide biosynthesis polyprenyl glycosylphosphotransferase
MMAHNQKRRQYLQLAFDVLAVLTCWGVSRALEVAPGGKGTVSTVPPELLAMLWLPITYWLRLYRGHAGEGLKPRVSHVAEASVLLSVICIIAATIFGKGAGEQGWRPFLLVALSALPVFTASQVFASLTHRIAQRYWPTKRGTAVVGTATGARQLIHSDRALQNSVGFRGLIVPEETAPHPSSSQLRVLGTTRQLAELINREDLERVIVLNDGLQEEERERCRRVSGRMGVTVSWIVGRWAGQERPNLAARGGLLLLDLQPVHFTRAQERVKRALDLCAGAVLTLLLSPVMLAIAVLVKATSPGPILYRSQRVGKGGRHFTFYKYRSMHAASERAGVKEANEKDGHLFKIRNDPRVTPLGRILRRYSLDELPQLVNVLRGDMSLVGPRPLPAADLDPDGMSRRFSAWSEHRARVRPGITGLWQISGRSELSFDKMMLLDVQYIREWSIALDLRILLQTPGFVLNGRGAF